MKKPDRIVFYRRLIDRDSAPAPMSRIIKVLWLFLLLVAFLILKKPDSSFIYGGF